MRIPVSPLAILQDLRVAKRPAALAVDAGLVHSAPWEAWSRWREPMDEAFGRCGTDGRGAAFAGGRPCVSSRDSCGCFCARDSRT